MKKIRETSRDSKTSILILKTVILQQSAKKTRKSIGSRPIPTLIMEELNKYVSSLDIGQGKIFTDNFSRKKWDKIRTKAGLGDLKFHDLCRTFSLILARNGISRAVTQKLLEHSSPTLTNKIYTNVEPVL